MLKRLNERYEQHSVTQVAGNQSVNVWYDNDHDMVALEIGATTINMETSHFFKMHEMMRKAAARLVMQVPLPSGQVIAPTIDRDDSESWLKMA